jgi:hypothetical protein
VYEDCRRDCEVQIGTKLLEDLAQPLEILFNAARWAVAEVATVMQRHMRRCLSEMQQEQQGKIDCHLFSEYVLNSLWPAQKHGTAFETSIAAFQEKWARVLGRPSSSSSSHFEEVRARALSMFPPRDGGWSFGRYVSPDLMIAADSLDAICRGDYLGVLGEIHAGNSMNAFAATHSDVRQLQQAIAEDTRNEMVVIRQRPKANWLARVNHDLILPHNWRYQFGDDPPNYPLCRPLPAGMLVVCDAGSSVMVQARDGSIQFDALELFAGPLLDEACRCMVEFRPHSSHMPRISLGNLVISREQWIVHPKDMSFLRQSDPALQFLESRAWARSRAMPRRVFITSPAERKPWFMDFESPMLTSIFAGLMKKLQEDASVKIAEMLPDSGQHWLVDRKGCRFTCELRMVARAVPVN